MDLHQHAEQVADRVMAIGDRDYLVSILEGAFEVVAGEANQAHVKITRTEGQLRIDIDKALRIEQALMLMAEAQELIRLRAATEIVHGKASMIATPNGTGGSRGGDVSFRIGKVGDPKP